MNFSNKLRAVAPLFVALLLVSTSGLQARNRKGDKLFKLGVTAEAHKEFDKALEYFQQAEKEDPKEATYELAARRARFEAATAHVDAGNKALKAEELEKALAEFQKGFNTD